MHRRNLRLLPRVFGLGGSLLACGWLGAAEPLTNLIQVHDLPLEEGTNGFPVKVRATVTYSDPEWRMMFVQDETGSAYVNRSMPSADPSWDLKPGQIVEIEGVTTPGVMHCDVNEQAFRIIGLGPLPAPLQLSSRESFSDKNETRWAKTRGFVSGVTVQGARCFLELAVRPDKVLRVIVLKGGAAAAGSMRGMVVEVTGVYGLELDSGHKRTGGNNVWIEDLASIEKLSVMPVTHIGDLAETTGTGVPDGAVRLQGNVMGQRLGEFLLVRDDSGSVRVNISGPTPYASGSSVEIFGYPGRQGGSLVIKNAIISTPQSAAGSESNPVPALAMPTGADTNLPTLTQVVQVRNLLASEAARGYPVRFTGVLTYSDPVNSIQFVQDESSGIFLDLKRKKFDALPGQGQEVQISGFSGPGDYAPVIHAEQVRALGQGAFPSPKADTIEALMTGSEDSQWVAIRGVIRGQSVENDNTVLTLWTGNSAVSVAVPNPGAQPAPRNYVDSMVEVQGVCATVFDDKRRLQGIRLYVPDWDKIQVREAALGDSFALPLRPISELLQFQAAGSGLHRSHVRGVALLRLADGSFYLQDATGGLLIQPRSDGPPVKEGETVELAGFPSVLNKLPVLQEAVVRPATGGAPLKPTELQPEAPFKEDLNGTLVKLNGRVIGHSSTVAQEVLTIEFGRWVTDAIMEKDQPADELAKIAPGSIVSLTGVYDARLDDNQKVQSFQLLLRSRNDVSLISHAPLWTARNTLWALGALGTVLFLALGWAGALRRQVRRQTRELRVEIEERRRIEAEAESTHKKLMVASRQAGMAEVATSVLHNVGNVLNSVNVSAGLLADQINRSKVVRLEQATNLMKEHAADLGGYLTSDAKGRQLPAYLEQLATHLIEERQSLLDEVSMLSRNVEHIKEIVAVQQSYAGLAGVTETVKPADLVEDALRMNTDALERHHVEVVREYDSVLPEIAIDRHKTLQILVNLVRNAKQACGEADRPGKRLTVRITCREGRIRISVADNGVGIPPENLVRIFSHGFTTRKDGHGFGLHSGALAARELGGTLVVHSGGPGLGATFTLELPLQPTQHKPAAGSAPHVHQVAGGG